MAVATTCNSVKMIPIFNHRLKSIFNPTSSITCRLLSIKPQNKHTRAAGHEQTLRISNHWYTEQEWDAAISRKTTFPAIMRRCLSEKKLITAKSLIAYLKHKNINPSAATVKLFLKLCTNCANEGGEESIVDICTDLKNTRFKCDLRVFNACLIALTDTKLWPDGIELIKWMENNKNYPSHDALNALMSTALRNKRFDLGCEILKHFQGIINNEVVDEWLNLCRDDDTSRTFYKLVDYLSSNDIQVPLRITEKMKTDFMKKGYVGNYVTISSDRFCRNCKNHLRLNTMLDEDFLKLRDAIMSLIKGKDLFQKTDPDELRRFQKLVKKTAPYDIVLDGLNVAYVGTIKTESALSAQLVKVVTDLTEVKKKKILILGTKQLSSWPKEDLFYLSMHSDYFMTTNQTVDDVFLLYAALASGPKTMFVSNDFMLDHKLSLQSDYLTDLFHKWQKRHQIKVVKNGRSGVELVMPTSCDLTAQRTKTTVHIPCSAQDESLTKIQTVPDKWLCLTKKRNSVL